MRDTPPIPRVIANWWLHNLLGSGYSGSIYKARHLHTGQIVALKVQHVSHVCPTNQYEKHIYPLLQGGKGMPTYWAGGIEGEWDYFAIDLLGASLDSIHRKAGGPIQAMDLGSVCSIAMQMIARLELMHTRGILHRDIQLGNTVIGLHPSHQTLYMIDFGFSKCYIDSYTRRHIPDSKAKRDFIGNYWFSSVNVHCRGKVPSRRDDLEACALMFIHLLTPRGLAWTRDGVPKTDSAHTRLKQLKRNATPGDLCRGLPIEFEKFLGYCRRLKFAEQPDYDRWIEEFRELKVGLGYDGSDAFVWPPLQPKSVTKTMNPPQRMRTPVVMPDALQYILKDLANLNLDRTSHRNNVLKDCKNVEAARTDEGRPPTKETAFPSKGVTELSSGSEVSRNKARQPLFAESKASRMIKLAQRASQATDNITLSVLVHEFVAALRCNSSRILTREASLFLDALHKQLEDPSVFVLPARTSQQRSDAGRADSKEPTHVKLGVVARLRREVGSTRGNRALAIMVEDFVKVTKKSTGRTITKDGFAFLEGLADKLK